MPFTTASIPDAPIIVHTHEAGPEVAEEFPQAMRQLGEVLNIQPEPVYLVINLSGVTMGLDDLTKTSSQAARGPDAALHHPNVIETVFVVSNNMLKLGVMGMASEAFGNAKVRTFDDYDQALNYCYERIAEAEQK